MSNTFFAKNEGEKCSREAKTPVTPLVAGLGANVEKRKAAC